MDEPIHVEHGDKVVSITLNRPARRNALSLRLLGALGEALSDSTAGDAGAVILAGASLGGAFDIAMSCDLRIASADAFFQVPATRLGLLYNPRSIVRMRRRLGRDAVFNLLVLGNRLDAGAALKAGVVSSVVGEGESRAAALKTVRLAAENVGSAVAASKALLDAIDHGEFGAGHCETVREAHLSSPERERAVAEAKARLKDS